MVIAASVTGIIFVALVAFKNQFANLFGMILALLFGFLSYQAGYLANAMSNFLYIAPMSLFGWWYWTKNNDKPVQSLSGKQKMSLAAVVAAGCAASVAITSQTGGSHFILDGISGFLPLIATVLLVFRFKEQWLLWIPYNAIEVVLWFSAASLAPEVFAIFIMRLVFFVNSVIGYFEWRK